MSDFSLFAFSELDDIDIKILSILTDNSRASFVAIAKEVGLSRVAIQQRVRALEEKGIIKKYTIILNPEKFDNQLSVYLDVHVDANQLNAVSQSLAQCPYIVKLYQMTGSSRLHIHALLKDNATLEAFLKDNIYNLHGLLEVECNTVILRIKDDLRIPI
ncbi:MAG: Lrp/AsnC family transcriptional regulator [Bacillota bacterium]